MLIRGIRGAITVAENTSTAVRESTKELLLAMVQENELDPEFIASAIFTVTKDIDADFPASAAREMGWNMVPLICATEIDVPGSLPMVIRVMIHVNSPKTQAEIKHIYLRGAVGLRKDLAAQ